MADKVRKLRLVVVHQIAQCSELQKCMGELAGMMERNDLPLAKEFSNEVVRMANDLEDAIEEINYRLGGDAWQDYRVNA